MLVLSIAGGYGGAERSLEIMLNSLGATWNIDVLAENWEHLARLRLLEFAHRIKAHQVPKGRTIFHIAWDLLIILVLMLKIRPSTVLTNSNKSAMLLAILAPIIPADVHFFVFIRDFQWLHAAWILKRLHGRAVLMTPSEALPSHWPESYGPKPASGEIIVVPSPAESPKRLPEPDGLEILCLANISRWKGIHFIVQAMPSVLRQVPSARLRIVGNPVDPEYSTEIDHMICELGLETHVERQSFIHDPSHWIGRCACIVNASLPDFGGPETFGRTVVEAWAHKKPVVATTGGGPEQLIEDGYSGFLVPPGDSTALSEAILKVLQSPSSAQFLAENGHQRFLQSFSEDAVANRMNSVLF